MQLHTKINELNKNLEAKIQERTKELERKRKLI